MDITPLEGKMISLVEEHGILAVLRAFEKAVNVWKETEADETLWRVLCVVAAKHAYDHRT